MKYLAHIFIFFFGLQALGDRYDALILGPQDFIQKMPFKAEDLSFSVESVRSIRFLENTKKEIDFSGKLGLGNELYLNGIKIPTNKNRQFKFPLSFLDENEKHEIKLKKIGISETSLFFRIKTFKESPAPIRAVFKIDESKTVTKSSVFTGKFPSAEWIQFSNIEPVEKMDPEFLAKQERERLEKERLEKERLEKERQEQERLALEKVEKERLEKERLEKERQEQERLALEKVEKDRLEKARLEKERQEQERLALEKVEKDRLEKARLEKERQEQERLALEKAEKDRLNKERLEKERQERAKLALEKAKNDQWDKERLEKERLEKERQEQERLALEKAEKDRLEKERKEQESERALTAEIPRAAETQETVFFKEPKGLELEQGLSFFSLTQTEHPKLNSMNFNLTGSYKTSLFDHFEVSTQAQLFLLPLSVTGAEEGPRLFRASGNLGWKFKADSGSVLTPQVGFQYQTLLTPIEIGYRNLGGPSVGLSYESPVGRSLFLHSGLSFNLFSSDTQIIAFSNNQLGFRLFLEWRKSSSFFSSYYLGAEYQTLSLTLTDSQLSSSNTSLFFGLRF